MTLRRIHSLHLTAPNDALIRRGMILLEDAFHTASLPIAETGRLVLIRSLDVGKIRSRQSSASLAVSIARRLRQLCSTAVHASDPTAPCHPVVYFRDELEPYVALIVRLIRGESTHAWFWQRVISNWQPDSPKDVALRHLLYLIAQMETGAIRLATLLQELQTRQALFPLLATLRSIDGTTLLQHCGWSIPSLPLALVSPAAPSLLADLPVSSRQTLMQWLQTWGATDPRSIWLATMLLIQQKPIYGLDQHIVERSQQVIQSLIQKPLLSKIVESETIGFNLKEKETQNSKYQASSINSLIQSDQAENSFSGKISTEKKSVSSISEESVLSQTDPTERTTNSIPEAIASHHPRSPEQTAIASEIPPPVHCSEPDSISDPDPIDEPQFTAHAGFFFLIPLLNYLNLPALLESQPDLVAADFPNHLLRHLADRLEIPADDPVLAALPALSPSPPSPPSLPLPPWRSLIRRWCRRYARIGLPTLIHRPGKLLATRTHIDLLFEPDQADIRIRRAGLDLNPGWVPWLGRVVLFHYSTGGLTDEF